MRIEIDDEVVKDGRNKWVKGDIVTVSTEVGTRLVAQGWATDLDGNVEKGSAPKDDGDLVVQNLTVDAKRKAK